MQAAVAAAKSGYHSSKGGNGEQGTGKPLWGFCSRLVPVPGSPFPVPVFLYMAHGDQGLESRVILGGDFSSFARMACRSGSAKP